MNLLRLLSVAIVSVLVGSCSGSDAASPCTADPCPKLSDYGLFQDGAAQIPVAGVVPYALISPLYSDHAVKHRFIKLPEGGKITYTDGELWDFPVGTVIIKTFGFPVDARDPSRGEQLIETRLLIRRDAAWLAFTYRWDADGRDATLDQLGRTIDVNWIDAHGTAVAQRYKIPDQNMCGDCHLPGRRMLPLGPRTRQLNRDFDYGAGPENQIDHMATLGMFDVAPPPAAARTTITDYNDATATIENRARAYLEANCAHCHNDHGGRAAGTGLNLMLENTAPTSLGLCKRPFAAGGLPRNLLYDVVPGNPDLSVLLYRVNSTDPEVQMPKLVLTTIDPVAVDLITQWIAGMPADDCSGM